MKRMTPILPSANPLVSGRLVAGIDTHRNTHHVAVVDHLGRPIADSQFPATGRGHQQMINFFHAHGHIDRVGVDGTGSYSAGIARELTVAGFTVVEIIRQNRQARRLRGKSDPIDAHQAALALLSGADTVPKTADGQVESLRILLTERRSAAKAKSQTMNQIHALLVTAPEPVRDTYRALGSTKIVKTLARTRPTGSGFDPNLVTRHTLKRLAVRYLILQDEIDEIEKQLDPLVRAVNPTLLSLSGIGLVTAAALLVAAGDNPERLATRATFAALAGVAPQPAPSGQRTRHRLSRGENRQANAALHRILLLRRRHQEPRTMVYFARRRAEGLTDRDIMRCLKRHVANEVYGALLNPATENPAGRQLRTERQRIGIPITVLAPSLGVPYQQLRRLEIGTRADPELEQRATLALARVDHTEAV